MPPLSTDYVFMSYSRRDDAVMRRIVAFLREQGIKVWVDNEKLIPGTPVWEKEIEKAVQGASAVVVVLSPDSKDSEWVRREISLADQYEKRVFPLLVRGDEKTSISIRLIGRQYVDIRSNEDAGLNYVSATLSHYLEELNEREQNAKREASRLAAQKIKTEKRLAARKAEEERIALEKVATDRKAKDDGYRLAAQKTEEERIAFEKVVTDRKIKEDADRLVAQKIEEERIDQEKAQADRKAKEGADLLAAQKMEEERIALEKVAADRKAKEDADRLAAQKAEEERIALEKAVAERKAKEEADRLTAQKAELDSKEKLARENTEREAREKLAREKLERDAREKEKLETKIESTVDKPAVIQPEPKKQSGMKLPLWSIGLIAFIVLALIVWKLSSLPASPNVIPNSTATQTPFVPGTPTLVPSTSTPQPTETLIPTPVSFKPTSQPTNMPPADPVVGSTWTQTIDGMTLLYVPAGEFLMGSTDADTLAQSDEKPQRTVTLDAYWIDQTEVTNAQYAKCVADNGACKEPTDKSSSTHSSYYGNSEFDHYPVLYVDWDMASAYCSWADRRLPTEAEWEKAARGENGNIYPWGINAPNKDLLNFNSNVGDTTEVGNYSSGQSLYGAYDMAGNVWEWVNDWYDVYPGGDSTADAGFGQKYRVVRGGSLFNDGNFVRSASRGWFDTAHMFYNIGFRCSRSP